MLGTIFQLSAAILLGYQIAFRGRKGIIKGTKVIIPSYRNGKRVKTPNIYDAFLETYIYQIGFVYLILGYLIPLTKYEMDLEISDILKLVFVALSVLILVFVGDRISKCRARSKYEKF